jgi:ornithine cyclodeaminase/alanine dehydrogenase-like protein (mu-crystallin family)
MERNEHIFAGRKTLIISMAEIKALMSMRECIDIQSAVFQRSSSGEAVVAPNTWLRLKDGTRWMKLLAGYVGGGAAEAMGMKVLARFPKNPPGMNIGSIVTLFDPNDGFPLAIMDGVYFTAARTGAAGGLSCLYCARKNSKRVGILGSGVQARFNLYALRELLPQVDQGFVFSRSERSRVGFVERMQRETGIALQPVASVEGAVSDADIIITATNSPQPVLLRKHLRPGQHIVAVGIKTEIEPSILKAARVIGDGVQTAKEDGKFSVALKLGVVDESDLTIEIGDVIADKAVGRQNDQEITLFDSSGLAVQDVICAQYVYEKARQIRVGNSIDLGLAEFP